MKSPDTLRDKLRRQWHSGSSRRQRLLGRSPWPLVLPIGKPTAAQMTRELATVRGHIDQWRRVKVGTVSWEAVNYRSLADSVELPISWRLDSPAHWVEAMADAGIAREYRLLTAIIDAVDPQYHPLLVPLRQQWLSRGADETILACTVADQLQPGCAAGRPLRALSIAGCDSKFFERNRALLTRLLHQRYADGVGEQGLEAFLGAADEGEHWLLVAPLETGLLPFEQLRLRSSELRRGALPGSHLLVIENERSLYQLPPLPGTVAVLGAGLNLGWLQAGWLEDKVLAYWGDIDSWGLTMLADARRHQPGITALMMDTETFDRLAAHTVVEPVRADAQPPTGLNTAELALYRHIHRCDRGRLEQEFIPTAEVHRATRHWRLHE